MKISQVRENVIQVFKHLVLFTFQPAFKSSPTGHVPQAVPDISHVVIVISSSHNETLVKRGKKG